MKKTLLSEVVDKTLHLSKCSILALTIGSMVITPAYSKNFIESAMSSILKDSMSTSTSPKAFRGATRGYVTTGNISTRVPIWSQKLISFQPPSVTAGCNGIDAFGGSFSFINADELVQLFRNIAANSVGLLFMLALETVSNEIGVNLKSFQNIIRDINNLVSDSCNAAKGIVSLADKALVDAGYKSEMNASLKAAAKDYGDHYDMLMNDLGMGKKKASEQPTADKEGLYGNVVWQAMSPNTLFGFNDLKEELLTGKNLTSDNMKELLMSITGSIIAAKIQSDPNGKVVSQSNNQKNGLNNSQPVKPLEATIKLSDFITGFNSASNKDIKGTWKCDDQEKCITPVIDEKTKFEGYSTLLYNALCGTTTLKEPCQLNSVIGKLATNSNKTGQGYSDDEQRAIMSLPPSFRARITRLAILNGKALQGDVSTVGAILQENINAISAGVVYEMIMDMITKIENRIKVQPNAYAGNFKEELANIRKAINDDFNVKLKTEYGTLNEALDKAEKNIEYIKKITRVSDISNIYNLPISDKFGLNSIPAVSKTK